MTNTAVKVRGIYSWIHYSGVKMACAKEWTSNEVALLKLKLTRNQWITLGLILMQCLI